ncbi:radical SAM protein [Candidatus Geothermarchaeota archaeon ex4572_27]|nr:MAG: radical SAM protein [Candidatus Geothermarchaeota archaeon ex4572_27]
MDGAVTGVGAWRRCRVEGHREASSQSKRVLPFYSPPTLIARQAAVALAFKAATGWRFEGRWLRSLRVLLRVAAGAKFAGCFGYEPHPVLEVTGRCNLSCIHCEVRGGELDADPPLPQVYRMIDSIATVPEFRMLVLSGGEPLVRPDIYEIIRYARDVGFEVTIATNGTLISREVARKLSSLDITGVAVSLDFVEPELHDRFRGASGAWSKAMEGMKHAVEEGLYLQVNITLSRLNFHELPQLLRLADELGSCVVLLYQFQPFGRGALREDIALTPAEFLSVMRTVASLQRDLETLVIPVGLPEYFAYLSGKTPFSGRLFRGCIAGRGMFYVRWNGEAWPCVFLQLSLGNVLEKPALEIWRENELLSRLRDRANLGEPCRSCRYREVCGGCRSRAYLATGNPLAADPACPFSHPKKHDSGTLATIY